MSKYVCTSACHQGFLSPASQLPLASWEQHFLPSALCMYIQYATVQHYNTIYTFCSILQNHLFIIPYIILYGLTKIIWMKVYTPGVFTLPSIVRYPHFATPNLAQYLYYTIHIIYLSLYSPYHRNVCSILQPLCINRKQWIISSPSIGSQTVCLTLYVCVCVCVCVCAFVS